MKLAICWILLGVLLAASAAGAQNAPVAIDLPAQPLSESLKQLGRQANLQLFFNPELVAGKAAPAVRGQMPPRQALDALLQGSGLESAQTGSGITLRRAAPAGQNDQLLPEVRVNAPGENAWGPVDGYAASRSAAATKTDTPILETPRSMSVIGAEQIADQRVADVGAALRYTPGVYSEFRGQDTTRPNLVMRGFLDITPLFLDGLRGFPTTALSLNPEVYGLERLEVLRGPAGTLYGTGSPGGIVNAVSKRPTREFFAELEVGAGSYDQFEGRFDVGGPLDADRKVLYRLTGLARDGDTQVDHTSNRRTFLAPALTLRPGPDTTFTLLAQYVKDDRREVQFVPAQGTVLPNPNGTIPTSRFIGEPGYGGYLAEQSSFGWVLEQRLGAAALLRQSLRYDHRERDFKNVGGLGLQADLRTLTRAVFNARDDIDSLATDTNVQLKLGSGAVAHTLLLGVEYNRASNSEWAAFDFGTDLDIFAPVYGQPVPTPIPYTDLRLKATQTGVYVQDQIKFGERLNLSLGARHDRSEVKTTELLTGTPAAQNDDATTWQGGLSYLLPSGLAPYASYAESFQPVAGVTSSGTTLEPVTGTQYEAGVKYSPAGSRSLVTLSLFELTQQNVITPDPVNPLLGSVQTGEMRSRGGEIEANLALAGYFNLLAGYTYTDIRVTKSNDTDLGKRPSRVPEHLASAWLNYSPPSGFGWGLGARYVGESFGDRDNSFTVPAFTLLDAALRYEAKEGALKGVGFALNASNLLDKTYVSSCEAEGFCIFGLRRMITGTVRVRF